MTTPEERASRAVDGTLSVYRKLDIYDDFQNAIAAELRAAVAEATRWIPVSERLPDTSETVNVLLSDVNQSRMAGQYTRRGWGVWGLAQDDPDGPDPSVVAWQPMPPQPPEEQP